MFRFLSLPLLFSVMFFFTAPIAWIAFCIYQHDHRKS